MILKSKSVQLIIAFFLGLLVFVLPRPEGSKFRITGDENFLFLNNIRSHFTVSGVQSGAKFYVVEAINPGSPDATANFLRQRASLFDTFNIQVEYVNGLSPKGKRLIALLVVLICLFVMEPVPLEITAICIGVFLVILGITDVKNAWAPYMHPVVVFIMCCLIFAISLDKAGLTKRLRYFIIRLAGTSVIKFTFILTIGLGIASSLMHDAAACAIGFVTMIPLMRASGIKPHTPTARFMMISLAFACSCGGMGTLIGGGRCMVAAAFLEEFTGIEIDFLEWIKYAMPVAIITVPVSVVIVYLVFRPDPKYRLPKTGEKLGPWTPLEKRTLFIVISAFLLWLTEGMHGIHYSVTGMLGVGALVVSGVLGWEDIHEKLEWGIALFIFGGGMSLGLAMNYTGAASYLANLFSPYFEGGGWLFMFVGVSVFAALITNAMANVATAALILPIVIPMAQTAGLNPTLFALSLGTASSFAMLLVIGSPPNAIAYSFRYFKASDLTKAGAVATPVLLAILIAIAALWWKYLGLI